MRYLFDTNWIIDVTQNEPEAKRFFESLAPGDAAVSIITYMEAYQGVVREGETAAARAVFDAIFDGMTLLPLSVAVAERCARVRHDLSRQGRRVNSRALDLIIAATAMEYGVVGQFELSRLC